MASTRLEGRAAVTGTSAGTTNFDPFNGNEFCINGIVCRLVYRTQKTNNPLNGKPVIFDATSSNSQRIAAVKMIIAKVFPRGNDFPPRDIKTLMREDYIVRQESNDVTKKYEGFTNLERADYEELQKIDTTFTNRLPILKDKDNDNTIPLTHAVAMEMIFDILAGLNTTPAADAAEGPLNIGGKAAVLTNVEIGGVVETPGAGEGGPSSEASDSDTKEDSTHQTSDIGKNEKVQMPLDRDEGKGEPTNSTLLRQPQHRENGPQNKAPDLYRFSALPPLKGKDKKGFLSNLFSSGPSAAVAAAGTGWPQAMTTNEIDKALERISELEQRLISSSIGGGAFTAYNNKAEANKREKLTSVHQYIGVLRIQVALKQGMAKEAFIQEKENKRSLPRNPKYLQQLEARLNEFLDWKKT